MKKRHLRLLPFMLWIFIFISACNLPSNQSAVPQDSNVIHTQAAQTVMAQLTQMAQGGTPLPTTQIPSNGDTNGQPTSTLAPTGTLAPTSTPFPSITPQPTLTQAPQATAIPCNLAQFVKDVTVSDGTTFSPGTPFTKTWRLKNIGSCAWKTSYSIVFVSGDSMGGESIAMPESVAPGETVDISVDLISPDRPGVYEGTWMLRNESGRFGLGSSGSKAFWVSIEVEEPENGMVYNFANSYCSATWESSAGELPCPGKGTEPSGFVIRLEKPNLENRHENEPTIWTNPQATKDGWITGTYTAFKIKNGDHFLADVGCMADSEKCDVIFQLNYRIDGGSLKSLGEWYETNNGEVTRIDIDLSALADKSVEFVLTVLANGASEEDAAFWLMPQIRRP